MFEWFSHAEILKFILLSFQIAKLERQFSVLAELSSVVGT